MSYEPEVSVYTFALSDSMQLRVSKWFDKRGNPKIQQWKWVKWGGKNQDGEFHPTGSKGICLDFKQFKQEVLPALIELCKDE